MKQLQRTPASLFAATLLTAVLLIGAEPPSYNIEHHTIRAASLTAIPDFDPTPPTTQLCLERFQRRVRECVIKFPCTPYSPNSCFENQRNCVDEAEVKYFNCISRIPPELVPLF